MKMMNLNSKLDSLNRNSYQSKWSPKKTIIRVVVILLVLGLLMFFPLRSIYVGAKSVKANAKQLSEAYKSQQFDAIEKSVDDTKDSLGQVDMGLNLLFWMRFIPFFGGYYMDAKGFSSAGLEELTAAQTLLENLKPYKEELGFNGQTYAGQDRISQAMKILDKSLPYLPKVQGNLKQASDDVKNIDVNKYPEEFRGIKLRESLATGKNFIMGSYSAVNQGLPALKLSPDALGENSPKTYLLLFQNDKEIRGTGGFLTAYAFLTIDKGQVTSTKSDDIYRLDERLLNVCLSRICPLTPPEPIAKYLPEADGKPRTAWSMRDSNLSPDIPTSAHQFEKMYQYLGEGLPFDGIIYIDTQVVEKLIEDTGPINIFDTTYSAGNDPRCNCPNVIYQLESYAEIAAKGEQDRKAILGTLMQQLLAKVVGADIQKLPVYVSSIVDLANQKHILFYMHNDKLEQALSQLNWTGEIKSYDGDYLHINDSNFAGGKSNLYVTQKVTQEINTENGEVKKKVTIEYKNPQPFNTWLNGINRDYVRLYVPLGSKLISSNGSDDPVNTSEDLGKTVFSAFITVRPQNSRTLSFEYTVPYNAKGKYKLMIQKQPGAKDFEYNIRLNGRQVKDFELIGDEEFQFSL